MFLLQELIDKGAIKFAPAAQVSTVVVAKELPSGFYIYHLDSGDKEKGDEGDAGRSRF